jgi:hypothetical protein
MGIEITVGLDDGFGKFISAGQFKQKQDRVSTDCVGLLWEFGREGRWIGNIGRTVFGLDQKRKEVGNGRDFTGEVFGLENGAVSIIVHRMGIV